MAKWRVNVCLVLFKYDDTVCIGVQSLKLYYVGLDKTLTYTVYTVPSIYKLIQQRD